MPSSPKINVDIESAGQRLDVFLSAEKNITRSQAQKKIKDGQVAISGRQPKKFGEILKAGDEIEFRADKPKTGMIKTEAEKAILGKIRIVAETPDYIVVDKPCGLLTHPTQAKEKTSLSTWLLSKYPEIKKVGDDPARPGIVHRLDKEASGLLVVARTQNMFNHLKELFKKRLVDKQYLVLVHGKIDREEGMINFPIGRSDTAEKMAAVPTTERGLPSETGKEALTEFTVERKFVNFTLLKIKIHTGRMHQIRAHMLAYNHPVVGDPLYFQRKQKRSRDKECGRMFLHCTRLGFPDLTQTKQTFESPLPDELKKFLDILKN